jgi:hypothetical protein
MARSWRKHLPGANLAAERLRDLVQRRHHELVSRLKSIEMETARPEARRIRRFSKWDLVIHIVDLAVADVARADHSVPRGV